MKTWNLQKYNLALDKKADYGYPETPQDAITLLNYGKTIQIVASAQKMMANVFSILEIRYDTRYENGTAIFIPLD